jgi:hypothetical protein
VTCVVCTTGPGPAPCTRHRTDSPASRQCSHLQRRKCVRSKLSKTKIKTGASSVRGR